jgi:hypothetical protein
VPSPPGSEGARWAMAASFLIAAVAMFGIAIKQNARENRHKAVAWINAMGLGKLRFLSCMRLCLPPWCGNHISGESRIVGHVTSRNAFGYGRTFEPGHRPTPRKLGSSTPSVSAPSSLIQKR